MEQTELVFLDECENDLRKHLHQFDAAWKSCAVVRNAQRKLATLLENKCNECTALLPQLQAVLSSKVRVTSLYLSLTSTSIRNTARESSNCARTGRRTSQVRARSTLTQLWTCSPSTRIVSRAFKKTMKRLVVLLWRSLAHL